MFRAVAVLVLLHDSPTHRNLRGPSLSLAEVRQSLSASWAHPGTRLGFWMHFSTQFSATALSLLWGYPFFVKGEHQSLATAGLLLTLMVLAATAPPGPGLAGGPAPVAPLDDGPYRSSPRSSSAVPIPPS